MFQPHSIRADLSATGPVRKKKRYDIDDFFSMSDFVFEEGTARADCQGIEFGLDYISYSKGQRLLRFVGSSAEGCAKGIISYSDTIHIGWFPVPFWDTLVNHAVPQGVRVETERMRQRSAALQLHPTLVTDVARYGEPFQYWPLACWRMWKVEVWWYFDGKAGGSIYSQYGVG